MIIADWLEQKLPNDIFTGDRIDRVIAMDKQVMTEGVLKRVIPCNGTGVLQMHEEHRFPVHDEQGAGQYRKSV